MTNNLQSQWSVEALLAGLQEFRRVDDGTDQLAFRLVGIMPARSVYVFLYGENPDLIHFDLEDPSLKTSQWDHAVNRGSVKSVAELRSVVGSWLIGRA